MHINSDFKQFHPELLARQLTPVVQNLMIVFSKLSILFH